MYKRQDLIKMDARGTEILSLERYIDGKARKADIFERPVAFNPDEITHAFRFGTVKSGYENRWR